MLARRPISPSSQTLTLRPSLKTRGEGELKGATPAGGMVVGRRGGVIFFLSECPCSSVDRVPASGAGDESSTLSGGTTDRIPSSSFRLRTGRGPAAGRLVWDQEVGSSNLPAPTIISAFTFSDCRSGSWSFSPFPRWGSAMRRRLPMYARLPICSLSPSSQPSPSSERENKGILSPMRDGE